MKLDDQTVAELLASIGAKTPTPGGGAVASLTAAIASALARMVVSYSEGRRSLTEHEDLHREAQTALRGWGEDALALAAEDAEAYGRLNDLWKLDEDDERRQREFPEAVRAAIDVPSRIIDMSIELLGLIHRLCGRSNALLRSDLAIAGVLAEAAARTAAWNVRINLPLLDDPKEREQIEEVTEEHLDRARMIRAAVEAACLGGA